MHKIKRGLEFLVSSVLGFGFAAMPESSIIPLNYNYYFKPLIISTLLSYHTFDGGYSKKEITSTFFISYSGAMLGQFLYPILSPYI